jgi:hypothetical protein
VSPVQLILYCLDFFLYKSSSRMSGSGGYYKYCCKYWLTYNCPNWVWMNKAPCGHCLVNISSFAPPPHCLLYRRMVGMTIHLWKWKIQTPICSTRVSTSNPRAILLDGNLIDAGEISASRAQCSDSFPENEVGIRVQIHRHIP